MLAFYLVLLLPGHALGFVQCTFEHNDHDHANESHNQWQVSWWYHLCCVIYYMSKEGENENDNLQLVIPH